MKQNKETYYYDEVEGRVKEVSINQKVDFITCCVCIGISFVGCVVYMLMFV